ncbi:MAG: TetR/AcrR family transcriptional regulator [Pseudomonadota bacterium]
MTQTTSSSSPSAALPPASASAVIDAIVDGAIECVRSVGLERMTVDDVARASGISRASIYRHIGNREAIQLAVFQRANRPFEAEAAALMAAPGSFAERLENIIVWGVAQHHGNQDLNSAFLHGLSNATLELFTSMYRAAIDRVMRPAFVAAQAGGEMRPELRPGEAVDWFLREMLFMFARPPMAQDELRRIVRQYFLPVYCRDRAEIAEAQREASAKALQAVAAGLDTAATLIETLRAEVRRLTHLSE